MTDMLKESAKDYLMQANKRLREAKRAWDGLHNHDTIYARGIERLVEAHDEVCDIWRKVLAEIKSKEVEG